MHPEPTPAEQELSADAAILTLLLDDDHQHPWTDEEVTLEIGDDVTTTDALARLQSTGLVHRHAGFVFPTRAAHRAAQLMR